MRVEILTLFQLKPKWQKKYEQKSFKYKRTVVPGRSDLINSNLTIFQYKFYMVRNSEILKENEGLKYCIQYSFTIF